MAKKNLVEVGFHGENFPGLKKSYKLAVSSVGEAIRAVNSLNKNKLFKNLLENDKKGIKYKVLINGREFESEKELNPNDINGIKNSELVINRGNLKSIDIVPVIEGAGKAGSIGAIILGAVLIVVGILVSVGTLGGGTPLGIALIMGGIGLVAAGVINLLTSPPKFEDFRTIEGGGKSSYLFGGPENTVREGGPVPVGYGRLLVGSQVISASYQLSHIDAYLNPNLTS